MRDVTDLAEFRARRDSAMQRRPGESLVDLMRRAELMTGHPSAFQRHVLDQFAGFEPSWVMVDEIHHWTENNTAFEQLRREFLNHITSRPEHIHWENPTPERRRESERVLRILRGTDHGSDDGNAEGHRDDPGVPRG